MILSTPRGSLSSIQVIIETSLVVEGPDKHDGNVILPAHNISLIDEDDQRDKADADGGRLSSLSGSMDLSTGICRSLVSGSNVWDF